VDRAKVRGTLRQLDRQSTPKQLAGWSTRPLRVRGVRQHFLRLPLASPSHGSAPGFQQRGRCQPNNVGQHRAEASSDRRQDTRRARSPAVAADLRGWCTHCTEEKCRGEGSGHAASRCMSPPGPLICTCRGRACCFLRPGAQILLPGTFSIHVRFMFARISLPAPASRTGHWHSHRTGQLRCSISRDAFCSRLALLHALPPP